MELENIQNQNFHQVFQIVRLVLLDSIAQMMTQMQLQNLKLVQQEATALVDQEQHQELELVVLAFIAQLDLLLWCLVILETIVKLLA